MTSPKAVCVDEPDMVCCADEWDVDASLDAHVVTVVH